MMAPFINEEKHRAVIPKSAEIYNVVDKNPRIGQNNLFC
jgi:hypothetical protein